MKITLDYANRSYGNDADCPDYDMTVFAGRTPAGEKSISLRFSFPDQAQGRGVNWENRGWVNGAHLSMPANDARRLAAYILWVLEQDTSAELSHEFRHSTGGQDA